MTRLIDADELTMQIMVMITDKAVVYGNDAIKKSKEIFALAMIAQAPTVDAVPVIRCKDCRWFRNEDDETWCVTWAGEKTNPDAFCAYAKPKDTTEEVRKQLKDMEQRREMDRKK